MTPGLFAPNDRPVKIPPRQRIASSATGIFRRNLVVALARIRPSCSAVAMQAMITDGFGGPEVFKLSEVPKPELRPGHVLVRVAATSVNPVDYKIRSGALEPIAPTPAILGCDVAGIVEAVGDDVHHFTEGDEVFGCVGGVKGCPGALAEYVLADARLLAPKPRNLSLEDAAALPLVAITAWDGLFDKAGLAGEEQRVLVYGGTGGVGHIALQLAKAAGCIVHATASTETKRNAVRDLGADEAVDYRQFTVEEIVETFTAGAGYDLVFDSVGGDNVVSCFTAAKRNGTVVSINTRCTADLAPLHQKSLSLHVVFMLIPMLFNENRGRHGEILRELSALVEAEKVRPLIHAERLKIPEVARAHQILEAGEAIGKIVLTW